MPNSKNFKTATALSDLEEAIRNKDDYTYEELLDLLNIYIDCLEEE